MATQSVVYEQPVNELTRVCLRLEHLTELTHKYGRGTQIQDTHQVVQAMTDILSLTDRPDLRGKFIKELMRQVANLQRFISSPNVDEDKLKAMLAEYEEVVGRLQNQSGKFANPLRQNEFLTSVRQHLSTPGGIGSFNHPAYHYWSQQPFNERQAILLSWLAELDELTQTVQFTLRMIRQSGPLQLRRAMDGFYQMSLDAQANCQLIRVVVPNTLSVFPEISVGRHGLSISFFDPTTDARAKACKKEITFKLSCCIL